MVDMAPSMVTLTVSSNLQQFSSERRFPDSSTIAELKSKLELLTGASSQSMTLELRTSENVFVSMLEDDSASLSQCSVHDNMIIHVMDSNPNEAVDTSVPKYEMSEESYASRNDSVLAWKKRQQLGRFNPEMQRERQQKAEQMAKDSEEVCINKDIKVDQRCEVTVTGQTGRRGRVAFVGGAHFKPGTWIGVQYDEPYGKNDGSADGKRYFTCAPNYGSFVRPQDVDVGDFPELDFDDEEPDEI